MYNSKWSFYFILNKLNSKTCQISIVIFACNIKLILVKKKKIDILEKK